MAKLSICPACGMGCHDQHIAMWGVGLVCNCAGDCEAELENYIASIFDPLEKRMEFVDLFDGAMNTVNGEWIECTEKNILEYDMMRRSGLGERAFNEGIKQAYAAGYTPKMWIVEEKDGTTASSEEGAQ